MEFWKWYGSLFLCFFRFRWLKSAGATAALIFTATLAFVLFPLLACLVPHGAVEVIVRPLWWLLLTEPVSLTALAYGVWRSKELDEFD